MSSITPKRRSPRASQPQRPTPRRALILFLAILGWTSLVAAVPLMLLPTTGSHGRAVLAQAFALAAVGMVFLMVRAWRQQTSDRRTIDRTRAALNEAQQLADIGTMSYRFDDGVWDSSPTFDALAGIDAAYPRDSARLLRLFPRGERLRVQRHAMAAFVDGEAFDIEGVRLIRPDGAGRRLHVRGKVVNDATGNRALLCTVQDISARLGQDEGGAGMTRHDPLTGLPGHRMLMARLAAMPVGQPGHGVLALVDVDDFKALNDIHGRECGDILLQAVAARIKGCAATAQMVARLDADRFMVLAWVDEPSPEAARVAAARLGDRLRNALAGSFDLGGVRYACTASLGITLFDAGGAGETLLRRAQTALQQAKAAGPSSARFYDPAVEAAETARLALESDLRLAVASGQFELHYQAQFDSSNHVCGAEVLVRWRHPVRGVVPPNMFIPLCEATGLIIPLGHWVLESACAQLAKWSRNARLAGLTISVNVSACQFKQPGFVTQVADAIGRTGVDPRRLKLELTESLLLENTDTVIATLRALKDAGVGISLDDFGTGYSSLAYLKHLPLDQIKIDQTFVRDILNDANDCAIVRTIVALGESFGIEVIAEGVETEGQRDLLAGIGCRVFQGYLFARPLRLAEFEKGLRERWTIGCMAALSMTTSIHAETHH